MRTTTILPTVLLLALGLIGCSDETKKTLIVQPQPGKYALTGHVRLTGRLAETVPVSPDSTGIRVIDDASGVQVYLQRPGGSVDSIVTINGVYEFRFNDPGFYRVFAWVARPETIATAQVTAAERDTFFAGTLELGPRGQVATYPNPFPSTGDDRGIGVEFMPTSDDVVEIRFLNLAGAPVYSYTHTWLSGVLFHLHWIGVNDDNVEVPNGSYWAVARADGITRYNLVFKE